MVQASITNTDGDLMPIVNTKKMSEEKKVAEPVHGQPYTG
jgi:hypothetical protein